MYYIIPFFGFFIPRGNHSFRSGNGPETGGFRSGNRGFPRGNYGFRSENAT